MQRCAGLFGDSSTEMTNNAERCRAGHVWKSMLRCRTRLCCVRCCAHGQAAAHAVKEIRAELIFQTSGPDPEFFITEPACLPKLISSVSTQLRVLLDDSTMNSPQLESLLEERFCPATKYTASTDACNAVRASIGSHPAPTLRELLSHGSRAAG